MRVLDDPVASPKESPAAPGASTVPDISGGLLSSLHRLVRRVSYGRRSCGMVPAQNGNGGSCPEPGGAAPQGEPNTEGAAGDIVWGTERPGQSCLVAGLLDVGKKDNKTVLASLEECTCRPTSK